MKEKDNNPTIDLVTSGKQELGCGPCEPLTRPCAPQYCIPQCQPQQTCQPMIPCQPDLRPPPPGCRPGPSRA